MKHKTTVLFANISLMKHGEMSSTQKISVETFRNVISIMLDFELGKAIFHIINQEISGRAVAVG